MDPVFHAFAALFPEATSQTVLGAMTGAMLFVVTAKDFSTGRKLILFAVSFVTGLLGAALTSAVLEQHLPSPIEPAVGAFVAGTLVVPLTLALRARLEKPLVGLKPPRGGDDLSPDFPYDKGPKP